jgi:hypothetical protein
MKTKNNKAINLMQISIFVFTICSGAFTSCGEGLNNKQITINNIKTENDSLRNLIAEQKSVIIALMSKTYQIENILKSDKSDNEKTLFINWLIIDSTDYASKGKYILQEYEQYIKYFSQVNAQKKLLEDLYAQQMVLEKKIKNLKEELSDIEKKSSQEKTQNKIIKQDTSDLIIKQKDVKEHIEIGQNLERNSSISTKIIIIYIMLWIILCISVLIFMRRILKYLNLYKSNMDHWDPMDFTAYALGFWAILAAFMIIMFFQMH